ncbi:MAG: hypothetical protein IT518_09460 [Burkholderiales bacterium]|nr:hypothetical protein [Burkholderiales bacterium]
MEFLASVPYRKNSRGVPCAGCAAKCLDPPAWQWPREAVTPYARVPGERHCHRRVADRRVVRLIQKWPSSGVLEDGKRTPSEMGTVQGGSVSPLLANLYLHYVFDLWVRRWRVKQARGDVVLVRFADDFVVGFQHRHEAELFLVCRRTVNPQAACAFAVALDLREMARSHVPAGPVERVVRRQRRRTGLSSTEPE